MFEGKYAHVYMNLMERAKTRVPSGYTERHHIIPRSFGGSNSKENIVRLTAREHFIAHLLLTKITTGENLRKMQFALAYMLSGQARYVPSSSKIFAIAKEARIKAQTGKKASLETRAKMSRSATGRKNSEESKIKLSATTMGKPASEKLGPAVSKAQTGKKRGNYQRHVSANADKGFEASERMKRAWITRKANKAIS